LQHLSSQSVSNGLVSSYEAQCALIGQLDQCVVIGQPLLECFGNVMTLNITMDFNTLTQLVTQLTNLNALDWNTVT